MSTKQHNQLGCEQNTCDEKSLPHSTEQQQQLSVKLFHLDDIELLYRPSPSGSDNIGMKIFRTTPSQIPLPNTVASQSGQLLTEAANDQNKKQIQTDGLDFVFDMNYPLTYDTTDWYIPDVDNTAAVAVQTVSTTM